MAIITSANDHTPGTSTAKPRCIRTTPATPALGRRRSRSGSASSAAMTAQLRTRAVVGASASRLVSESPLAKAVGQLVERAEDVDDDELHANEPERRVRLFVERRPPEVGWLDAQEERDEKQQHAVVRVALEERHEEDRDEHADRERDEPGPARRDREQSPGPHAERPLDGEPARRVEGQDPQVPPRVECAGVDSPDAGQHLRDDVHHERNPVEAQEPGDRTPSEPVIEQAHVPCTHLVPPRDRAGPRGSCSGLFGAPRR